VDLRALTPDRAAAHINRFSRAAAAAIISIETKLMAAKAFSGFDAVQKAH
jgi:hypothetical protein